MPSTKKLLQYTNLGLYLLEDRRGQLQVSLTLISSLESLAMHHYSSQDPRGSVALPAFPSGTAWIRNLGARSTQLIFAIDKKKKEKETIIRVKHIFTILYH